MIRHRITADEQGEVEDISEIDIYLDYRLNIGDKISYMDLFDENDNNISDLDKKRRAELSCENYIVTEITPNLKKPNEIMVDVEIDMVGRSPIEFYENLKKYYGNGEKK